MKLERVFAAAQIVDPAVFGRLCVETALIPLYRQHSAVPAVFGRLCVETAGAFAISETLSPASRLRAAVC